MKLIPFLILSIALYGWLSPRLAQAQSPTSWRTSATDGNWNNAANWTNGIPTIAGDLHLERYAVIEAGPTNGPVITSSVSSAGLRIGQGETGVGEHRGILTINQFGVLETDLTSFVGAGQEGTVNLNNNAQWVSSADISVGFEGTGNLNIRSTSIVAATFMLIGNGYFETGNVLVDGSARLLLSQGIVVGDQGTGNLTISNGGRVVNEEAAIGRFESSRGTVRVDSSGLWSNRGNIDLIRGDIYLNGGEIISNSGTGRLSIANGELHIGIGTTAGALSVKEVVGNTVSGGPKATISFSHDVSNFVFAPDLKGDLAIKILGGTTIFTGVVESSANIANNTAVDIEETMQIGNGGTAGTLNSNVYLSSGDSVLRFNRSNAMTITSAIDGVTGASIHQAGSGAVTLSAISDELDVTVDAGAAPLTVTNNWLWGGDKYGGGKLILLGSHISSSQGSATIYEGTLELGNGTTSSATFASSYNVTSDGELVFNRLENIFYDGQINSPLTTNVVVRKVGSNTLTFNGTIMSYAGRTSIDGGTLSRSVPALYDDTWYSTTVGTGAFVKDGAGRLDLNGSLTHTGGTTVKQGTLWMNTGSISGPIVIDAGGILRTRGTISSALSGNGGIRVTADSGARTILAGSVSLRGTSTIESSGILELKTDIANTLPGTFNINSGGAFYIASGSSKVNLTGTISNSGNFTVNGALVVGGGSSSSTTTGSIYGNVTVNGSVEFNNGSLDLSSGGNYTGTGTVTKSGSGTTRLISAAIAPDLTIQAGTLEMQSGSITSEDVSIAGTLAFKNDGFISSHVTGAGRIERSGTGSTVVTGYLANTGGITVTSGTLQFGSGSSNGNAAGNILNNGTVVFNRIGGYEGVISGSGSIVYNGTDEMYLEGINTYTGGTVISSGTLYVVGSLGSGGVVNNGALQYHRYLSSDALSETNNISGSGSVRLSEGQVTFSGTNSYQGTTTLEHSTVLRLSKAASLSAATTIEVEGAHLIANVGGTGEFTGAVSGAGSLGNLLSRTSFHFSPFGTNIFTVDTGNAVSPVTYTGNLDQNTYNFRKAGSGTLVLAGNNVLDGEIVLQGGTLNAGSAEALGGNGTISFAGGTLQYSAANNIDYSSRFAGGAYKIDTNGQDVTFGSNLNGSLNKLGSGALSLAGDNDFAGGIIFGGGTLEVAGGAGLGFGGDITFSGGTLRYGTEPVTDYSARFVPTAGQHYRIDTNGQDVTYGSNLSSAAGLLTKSGTGTLILGSSQSYSGATSISGGTLRLEGSSASPSFAIGAGAVLDLAPTGDYVTSTTFSGSGTLRKSGSGGARWASAATTFSLSSGSLIDVQAGTFVGGANGNEIWTDNKSDLNVAAGAVFNGVEANVRVDALTGAGIIRSGYNGAGYQGFTFGVDNGSGAFEGVLENNPGGGLGGRYVKTGAGIQILSGNNTYTGATVIEAGTLQIGNGGTSGSLASPTVENNGTLIFNRGNGSSFAGAISGNGGLVKRGAGTLTLTGDNTYTGTTTIQAGALALGSAGALGNTGTISFTGGTLQFSASNTTDYSSRFANTLSQVYGIDTNGQNVTFASRVASPSGSLTKLGAGTLTLSGTADNTALAVVVADGTVVLGKTSTASVHAIGGGAPANLIVNSGGTARLGGAGGDQIYSGAVVQVNNGGVFDLNGRSEGFSGLTGSGAVTNTAASTTSILTLGQDDGSSTFSGALQSGAGSLAFSKTGSGTVTLNGSSTYSGGTTVQAGTLILASNQAAGTGAVRVNNGTLLLDNNITIANTVELSGGTFRRTLEAGANLANTLNATSAFAGGQPDTTARILQGTLSSADILESSFHQTSTALNDEIRLSDVYSFHGTGSSMFVLQLSMAGLTSGSYLGWLDTNDLWVNAVDGNSSGTPAFFARAYNAATDFHLGYYGVDQSAGTVWAVLDHNSEFTIVPEPGIGALLGFGALLLIFRRTKVKGARAAVAEA